MKKIVLLTVLAVLIILPAKTRGQIRYNQVGCYPQQEKIIVVEDTASIHKLKIKTPKGKNAETCKYSESCITPFGEDPLCCQSW